MKKRFLQILCPIIVGFCFISSYAIAQEKNTAEDLVAEMYESQIDVIFKKKAISLFQDLNIPYTESILNSRNAEYDVVFDRVIADMREFGVTLEDFNYSRICVLDELSSSNEESKNAVAALFNSKNMDPEQELVYFNNYLKALYADEYTSWQPEVIKLKYGEELNYEAPENGKVKFSSEAEEPITGGKMWTFANGVNVVFKQMEGSGRFSYALLLKGGYGSIPDLNYGEGAYVSDIFELYSVGDYKHEEFHNMLRMNNIEMSTKVNLVDMVIQGSAPSESLPAMMNILLDLADKRSVDQRRYNFYRECEYMEVREEYVNSGALAVADSLMRPDYDYSQYKHIIPLSNDLMQKVDAYFNSQFSKVNDGMIIIVGDLEEVPTRKLLSKYLGAFRTNKLYSTRPKVNYSLKQENFRVERTSVEPQANYIMSMLSPLTSERYLAFRLASIVVYNEIKSSVRNTDLSIYTDYEIYPHERFTMMATALSNNPRQTVEIMKDAINNISVENIEEEEFNVYKLQLLGAMEREKSNPEFVVKDALTRYSEGKNLTGSYKSKVDKIKIKEVLDIIEGLRKGSSVEYLVN